MACIIVSSAFRFDWLWCGLNYLVGRGCLVAVVLQVTALIFGF